MVDERKVPVGYKVTEVGIIPDEWEVIDFNDCFELLPNNTFSRSELNYNCGDFKNIHYGDILIKFSAILDCSAMEIPFINTNHLIKNNRALVKDGDIIFADTAEDETVGKAIEIFNAGSQKLVSGLHTIPCRPKVIFEPKWLGYYLNHSIYHDQLLPYITGTKVSAISKSSIKETKVVKPLPAEQKSIAEALSDTDNLIQSVKKLIDKNKKIKQGAMQQLLTGKKRLPGFSGEWEEVNLGDICSRITTGKLDANAMKTDGIYRFYTCAKEYYWIDKYSFDDEALLISGNGANVGYIHYYKGRFNAYQRTYVLTGFSESIIYVKYYLEKYLADRISAEVNAGNTPYIKMDTLTDMIIKLPPQKDEQKAIAQVLSDMDLEIEALEEKLEKYKTIKQGMMQELLTGRIRFI